MPTPAANSSRYTGEWWRVARGVDVALSRPVSRSCGSNLAWRQFWSQQKPRYQPLEALKDWIGVLVFPHNLQYFNVAAHYTKLSKNESTMALHYHIHNIALHSLWETCGLNTWDTTETPHSNYIVFGWVRNKPDECSCAFFSFWCIYRTFCLTILPYQILPDFKFYFTPKHVKRTFKPQMDEITFQWRS